VFWKEMRELRVAAVVLALVAFWLGMLAKRSDLVAGSLIIALGFEGYVLGAWQGFLDRREAADEFLLHRPVSTMRIHLARGAAGAAMAGAACAVTLAVMLLVPYRRGFGVVGKVGDLPEATWWSDFTPGRAAFAVLVCLAAWAVARLGASSRRPVAAVFLAIALSLVSLLMLGRTRDDAAAIAITVGAAVVAATLTLANLNLRRVAGRS
jgi:hypothetical protein